MNRDQVAEDVELRHEQMIAGLCKTITLLPTDVEGWNAFVNAIMSLPGVSGDNVTRADIEQLTMALVSRVSDQDVPSGCPDLCWIKGPHVRHSWRHLGHRHSCEGMMSTV